MKKILFAILLLASPLSFAQEAKGIIEEIQICGTGTDEHNWARTLQFKVDGKWFATWADYYGQDYDNNISTSLLFMAASQKLSVHIKATAPWHTYQKKCGITDGKIFHKSSGDFIRIVY
ncbi:hypothetical protein [Vibrio caribbeanicus]|uniref:Uncharacterized protein n=1 Tax=Vibrio caribbeanicus ATCC BAA-2122 TaxID=796620 RepID=E3BP60_9VIBR|nr:hypothetical protein [Vibrio caribbeanicus]EFP95192.1 hypothetical protein VIBC2010_19485 [Vibrio caribbeanicus ATCC BAA-2122]